MFEFSPRQTDAPEVIGRRFVLGLPNAKGVHVMVFNNVRYEIDAVSGVSPGDRVKIVDELGAVLKVEKDA